MKTFDALLDRGAMPPERELHGSLLAQIIYTSGTEARPKGACSRRGVIASTSPAWSMPRSPSANVVLCTPCPSITAPHRRVLGPCVYVRRDQRHHRQAGARQPAAPDGGKPHQLLLRAAHRLDLTAALARVRRHRLSALAKGYYGGLDHAWFEVLKEMQRRLPKCAWWNLYGQTEIAPVARCSSPRTSCARPLGRAAGPERRDPRGRRGG